MTDQRKAWKLQECVAHSPGSVTCLTLGRKSGRVMATGGEDKKVNMWAVGKPSCILSLAGHTTSVEAVEFSHEENRVAAGSLSGAIRIWDLEEVKMVRALSGHTAGVRSLDFHPYGNFVASGSMDCNVKLWDINRKGCIYTYKGHTGAINMLRFSPDGKWIISAGEDGIIKLWDLQAGKQLTEFTHHTGPVLCVAFHPNVLLMASASADRTVKLYDLETLSLVSSTLETDAAAPVKRVVFHPEGTCIYAATGDLLKIYSSEPSDCLETVSVGWRYSGVADMAVAPSFNQLIGASISQSVVTSYVIDVKSCAPFVQPPVVSVQPQMRNAPDHMNNDRPFTQSGANSSARKSFCRVPEQNNKNIAREQSESDSPEHGGGGQPDSTEDASGSVIQDPVEYNRVFHPRRTLNRSPVHDDVGGDDEPFVPPPSGISPRADPTSNSHPPQSASNHSNVAHIPANNAAPSQPPTSQPRPPKAAVAPLPSAPVSVPPPPPQQSVAPQSTYRVTPPEPTPTPPSRGVYQPSQPVDNSYKGGVEVDDFLPKSPFGDGGLIGGPGGPAGGSSSLSETEVQRRLREPHDSITMAMSARQKNLSTVRLMWSKDNVRTALESAILMNDPAILVDLLGVLVQNSSLWSLDLASFLLPQLHKLTKSKYARHVECALMAVKVVMKNFSGVIRQNCSASSAIGVDIQREERQRKCQACFQSLMAIRSLLETKEILSKAGPQARELQVMMAMLDQ